MLLFNVTRATDPPFKKDERGKFCFLLKRRKRRLLKAVRISSAVAEKTTSMIYPKIVTTCAE